MDTLSSYWHTSPGAATAAEVGKSYGLTPIGLLDEPEKFKDVDDYCSKLLDSLIEQTRGTVARHLVANTENPWPKRKDGSFDVTDLKAIEQVAYKLRDVIQAWRRKVDDGQTKRTFSAYGLFVGDPWGWATNDGRRQRDEVVAKIMRGSVDYAEVDAYFTMNNVGGLNGLDGDPAKFLARNLYPDVLNAVRWYDRPARVWCSQMANKPGPAYAVPHWLWSAVCRNVGVLGSRLLIDSAVHFAGWAGSGPVPWSIDEERYVREFANGVRPTPKV